jgi:multiple RNA-binding domain-containing protein 1
VEYKLAADAQRAFKSLAYKRIGNAVLYLEKGPMGMFTTPAGPTPAEKEAAEKAALVERVNQNPEAPAEDDEKGSTLFLKNLSFNTTTVRLQSVLSSLPGYSFARVQTKPDPKRPGETLSMGYGFVGFKTRQEAQKALGGLEGFEIDGKTVEPKFAQRGADEDPKDKKKGESGGNTKGTKVLVKNLPFEVSKKEVRELFSAYGTVKSLRLPRKPLPTSTGAQSTRGFAFLEFTTHAEAVRAMDALKHTHLLGRHLVLEWAREGESVDVDALREKVSRDVRASGGGGTKGKRKLDLGLGAEGQDDLDA